MESIKLEDNRHISPQNVVKLPKKTRAIPMDIIPRTECGA